MDQLKAKQAPSLQTQEAWEDQEHTFSVVLCANPKIKKKAMHIDNTLPT
jgi:hypothetical protein